VIVGQITSVCNQPTRSTQPGHPSGVGVLACLTAVKSGAFTCVGWHLTLCDPIWQVTLRSSEIGCLTHSVWRPNPTGRRSAVNLVDYSASSSARPACLCWKLTCYGPMAMVVVVCYSFCPAQIDSRHMSSVIRHLLQHSRFSIVSDRHKSSFLRRHVDYHNLSMSVPSCFFPDTTSYSVRLNSGGASCSSFVA